MLYYFRFFADLVAFPELIVFLSFYFSAWSIDSDCTFCVTVADQDLVADGGRKRKWY
jgi:hypothetical protein